MSRLSSPIWPAALLATALTFAAAARAAEPHALSDGVGTMTVDEARNELQSLAPEMRARVAGDANAVSTVLSNALADRRVEAAARAAGLADLPDVKARIAKLAQGVLVKRYLDDQMTQLEAAAPDFTQRAKEIYQTSLSSYKEPEAIRAAHILFRVDVEDPRVSDANALANAEKALQRLKEGESFDRLVQEYSGDRGSVETHGVLRGWQERGTLVPPFEEAAYALKPGEMSGIVKTRFGYHIIKLLEHRPERTKSFDEAKPQIVAKLRIAYLQEKRSELLARFAGKVPVKVDDETMAALAH